MNDQTSADNVGTENQEAAAPAPKREIIRGRMPVAVVAMVRFGSLKDSSTKEKAEAFGTTVGKIDDIVKNRNFAYVTADFVPTEQQKADAIAWLERHPEGAQDLIDQVKAGPTATEEQAAAFEAARAAARGQSSTTKEGEPAAAGGGNRRGKGKKAADAPADGDALLS